MGSKGVNGLKIQITKKIEKYFLINSINTTTIKVCLLDSYLDQQLTSVSTSFNNGSNDSGWIISNLRHLPFFDDASSAPSVGKKNAGKIEEC